MNDALTQEQYRELMPRVASYAAVDPMPDSRYGRWLLEVMPLIEAYERAHFPFKLTHEDVQQRVNHRRLSIVSRAS